MNLLTEISKDDKFYREKAFKICKSKFAADDIVQDLYIRLSNYNQEKLKFLIDKKLVKWVCVRILNQIFLDGIKTKKEFVSLNFDVPNDEIDETKFENEAKIQQVENRWLDLHWFDKKMVKIYFGLDLDSIEIKRCSNNKQGMTIREISKYTGIPQRTVWETLKRAKNAAKE